MKNNKQSSISDHKQLKSIFILSFLMLFSLLNSNAWAINKIHQCDIHAAHPDDIGKWAKGVTETELAPGPAIMFCEEAVNQYPNTARFHFQLGRSLMRAKRYREANEELETAAQLDYGPAWAYLGDVFQFGLGEQADKETAIQFYQYAVNLGFEPALVALETLTKGNNIPLEGYYFKNLMKMIDQDDIASIPDDVQTRSAVISIYTNFNKLCTQFEGMSPSSITMSKAMVNYQLPLMSKKFENIQKSLPQWLNNYAKWQKKLDRSLGQNGGIVDMMRGLNDGSAAISRSLAMLVVEGVQDGKLFYSNHQCSGPEANRFINNISKLFISRQNQSPAPFDVNSYNKLRLI